MQLLNKIILLIIFSFWSSSMLYCQRHLMYLNDLPENFKYYNSLDDIINDADDSSFKVLYFPSSLIPPFEVEDFEKLIRVKNLLALELTINDQVTMNSLDEYFPLLETLTFLSLENCNLDSIPLNIFDCTNLRFLNISGNNLNILPREINQLSNLEHLIIDKCRYHSGPGYYNSIVELPSEITSLEKLKILSINCGQLKEIPPFINSIEKLEVLNLSSNLIKEIPDNLFKLKSLKQLSLSSNPINQLSEDVMYLSDLEVFSINIVQKQDIDFIFELSKLKRLSIDMPGALLTKNGVLKLQRSQFVYLTINDCELYGSLLSELKENPEKLEEFCPNICCR